MAATHPKRKDTLELQKEQTKGGGKKKKNKEMTKGRTIGGGDIVGDFIEDVWKVTTPEMVERLRCVLIDDMGLSKPDADKLIQDQRNVRRQRICLPKVGIIRIGPRNQWIKELSRSIADQMALFVVGMLLSNRNARSKRITEKILEHLCELTGENTTVETAKTRVERTLVVVADRMATWMDEAITDIESKIEEKYKTAASLEDLSRESLITSESSETESEESKTSVCSEKISEVEESEIGSEVTLSLKSSESEEKEEKESEMEEESVEYDAELREEEEERSEEEQSEAEEKTEQEISGAEEKTEEEISESEAKSEVEKTEDEEKSEEDKTEEDEEKSEASIADIRVESDVETEEETVDNEEAESEEKEEDEGKVDEVSGEEEEQLEKEEEEEEEEEKAEEEEEKEKDEKEEVKELDVTELEKESIESVVSEISIREEKVQLPTDLLDLLKEDVAAMPKVDEKSDRQRAMREVIDKRFEKIAREKLEKSLSSLIKYDIGEAASIVANWVEMILSSADEMPIEDLKPQGPAFEIKRGEGSQFQVHQVSSTTVAKKVAELKGLETPPRKKKLPRTMSPMNLTSCKDWADWALSAANTGEEWGKWLDTALADVENHLFKERESLVSHMDRYKAWKELKEHRGSEAKKWRLEDKKIKDEGSLWSRKLKKDPAGKPESEIKTDTY